MVIAEKSSPRESIYVVDDDASLREALAMVFTVAGYRVTSFADGASFLAAAHVRPPSCVILDVHMPALSGMEILNALKAPHYPAPIFILSGDAEVAQAVTAIKRGAFDYIVKPFDAHDIVTRIGQALRRGGAQQSASRFPGEEALTGREREVLTQIAAGYSNKEAGRRLGISPRTIEVHRARIMEKLGARNAADLVRIVLAGASSRVNRPLACPSELVA